MVILTIILVPLIALSFDHKNHSKWPKWDHVRYIFILVAGRFKAGVAKMASHAIFQYNVLAIDDTYNTWTNMIVKMNIRRLLGSSDDKEKISVARPEGPPLKPLRSKGQELKRP